MLLLHGIDYLSNVYQTMISVLPYFYIMNTTQIIINIIIGVSLDRGSISWLGPS